MPIVDLNDPALFRANYDIDASRLYYSKLNQLRPVGEKPVRLGYNRYVLMDLARARARGIRGALNLTGADIIVVIGAGFGWLVEAFLELWPAAKIAATDISAWVHTVKDQDETDDINASLDAGGITDPGERANWRSRLLDGARARVTILNEDLATAQSRKRVKDWLAENKVTWAISEDVLPWLYDDECQTLSTGMHRLATNVAHFVTPYRAEKAVAPEPPPAWNWKTIEDWKLLLPADAIIEAGTYRSL